MSGWSQCIIVPHTILPSLYVHETKPPVNHHKTNNCIFASPVIIVIVQRIIRQGCRQFWQCRKCGLGSETRGDHNGVINMTLLCNQWSESHNGPSLGGAEVMTHDYGTQCGCGHAETSQHRERWGAVTRYSRASDTSPTPHSASRADFTHGISSQRSLVISFPYSRNSIFLELLANIYLRNFLWGIE